MKFYHWQENDLFLSIQVQPKASRTEIVGVHNNRLKIKITAPPVDGKANEAVLKFLANTFGVAKSRVILLSGETSRDKRFCVKLPQKLPDWIKKKSLRIKKV